MYQKGALVMSKKADLSALFGANDTSSFLGLETCDDLKLLNASLALIGIPCATPYKSVGPYCKNAPNALRGAIASLSANVDRHNFDLDGRIFPKDHPRAVDCGDLSYDEDNFQANRENIFKLMRTKNSSDLPQVIEIIKSTGALNRVEETCDSYINNCLSKLNFFPDSIYKTQLTNIVRDIKVRDA